MSETTIYEYGQSRYYNGISRVIGPMEGIPLYWTDKPLPPIPDGQFAVFSGIGWVLTPQPVVYFALPEEPPRLPHRVVENLATATVL